MSKIDVPKIILAMPRYSDEVVAESYLTAQNGDANELFPDEDAVEVVHKISNKASLLPFSHNVCLAEAMNKRDEGVATHVAYLHSDIACEAGWLNKLAAIMRDRGDVAVSAVVCIKEPKRLRTSAAVGARGNNFAFKRFITTADRLNMPETFSTADVAEESDDVLLINTGVLLMDLRWPGFDDFAFGFDDAILTNPETGKRQAFVCPEDWRLSRALDEMGAPYSATFAVRTFHYGPSIWDSHEVPITQGAFQ
jgi:hypothetical protein